MITVINDTPSSLFEGMTIEEAANQMVFECMEAVHNFEMDTVLTEHAYLFENGCELEYVSEAGEATKEGKGFIESAKALIDQFKAMLAELWDKLTTWVVEKLTAVNKAMVNAGIKQRTLQAALNGVDLEDEATPAHKKIAAVMSKSKNMWIFSVEKLEQKWLAGHGFIAFTGEKTYAMNEYFNEAKATTGGKVDKPFAGIYADAVEVVYNTKGIVAKIKESRKVCDDELNSMKKNIAKDSDKSEAYNEKMAAIKKALNSNACVCRDKIKLYTTWVSESIKVVKAVVSTQSFKDRVKFGAGDLAQSGKEGVSNAGKAVASVPGKIGKAFKGGAANIKAGADKAKSRFGKKEEKTEATQESAMALYRR